MFQFCCIISSVQPNTDKWFCQTKGINGLFLIDRFNLNLILHGSFFVKIAYFINQYPKVSHSFIRREIIALEKSGLALERFALRANLEELVDPYDIAEFGKTHYIIGTPIWKIAMAVSWTLLLKPIRFISVLWSSIQMGWRSDRGILKHLFYFIEACLLKKLSMILKQVIYMPTLVPIQPWLLCFAIN